MPKTTPGYMKNMIKRSLNEIIDPSPKQKEHEKIWAFFENECAYCGKKLDRSKREGHIDHLVSSASGGANHLSNRVLSCVACNADEKMDKDWHDFLKGKIKNQHILKKRIQKILNWKKLFDEHDLNELDVEKTEIAYMKITKLYDKEIKIIRDSF